jgi:hypothetical protein
MANIQMIKTNYPIQETHPLAAYGLIIVQGWETNEKLGAHASISIKINNRELL